MSVRHYGIYLAYPPTVDLRAEGLGRHLAMFLKGAEQLTDVRFTIVCPSWSRDTLDALFESEQVAPEILTIVTPEGQPYALRLFEALRKYRTRPKRRGWVARTLRASLKKGERFLERWAGRAVAVHDVGSLAGFLLRSVAAMIVLLPVLCMAIPFGLMIVAGRKLSALPRRAFIAMGSSLQALRVRASAALTRPENDGWIVRLYERMQDNEIRRMHERIDSLPDVRAWYCPTSFWPSFLDIRAPRLMCVPDVVLSDFPVGFSNVGGDRFLATFEAVELTIRKCEHFVTYSETVKWHTLVDRHAVAASRVAVIPHAPNVLNRHVEITGFPDAELTSRHYCQTLLRGALQRSNNPGYTSGFHNGEVRFLFYASQLRPNKNVLMLLRAFEFLLRKRYLGHKLVLTGNPATMPEIDRFVIEHRLENDVIFVHGLSLPELAAFYKLAALAVNPSLSEGGRPFTFTEALSVGTPVVMSRIPVTEESLSDPHLQSLTLFDPFDWMDCARRIEWAVKHRDELLKVQLATYALLVQRTWTDVVAEHVKVMDEISAVPSITGHR